MYAMYFHKQVLQLFMVSCAAVLLTVYSMPQDLETSATGHGGHGGSNYQYAAVPHYGAWEFGYKRGNPYHFQERHEVGRGHNFKTKVRWGDKYGGYGEQYYDYNHADKGYGKGGGNYH